MSLAFLSRVTEGEDELDLVETVNESLARAFSLPFPQPRCFCKGLSFKTIAVDLHSFTFLVWKQSLHSYGSRPGISTQFLLS